MDPVPVHWLYSLALAGGLACSLGSFPLWRRWAARRGLVDRPGPRKIHRRATALAGGPMIATGLVLPLAAALLLGPALLGGSGPLSHGLAARSLPAAVLALGAVGMLALGMADDRRALGAPAKLGLQLLAASAASLWGVRIDLLPQFPLAGHALAVLWILLLVNAYNLSDNMNGLCGGLALLAALALSAHAALPGRWLAASFGFLAAGALAGFLPCNFPRARVFLGDSGSHLAGYLVAVLSILPLSQGAGGAGSWAAPPLLAGVALADTAWVVLHRLRRRRPVWVGDTNHLSHLLVRRGLSPGRAVALLWLAQALLCALSFLAP